MEEAIRIRDELGGKVTVVSTGPGRSAEALRTALAMGADEAVLISDDRIPAEEFVVSQALAAFLSSQNVDLILGGNFSVDQGAGQVAVRVASLLDLPHVGSITKLELTDGKALATETRKATSKWWKRPCRLSLPPSKGLMNHAILPCRAL